MRESDFFRPIKNEFEREKESDSEVKPLTADERETEEEKPMNLKDYGLTLRKSIQEKLEVEQNEKENQEQIKLLSELIDPELMTEYRQILKELKVESAKTEESPHGNLVDLEKEEVSGSVEKWIDGLIENVKGNREVGFDETDIEELRQQCWMFFDATANVINTRTIEKEVVNFYKDKKIKKGDKKEAKKQRTKLAKELEENFDIDQAEAGILIDIMKPVEPKKEGEDDDEYSAKVLYDTVSKIYEQYNLGKRKGKLAKISAGFLFARGIEAYTPSMFSEMVVDGKFDYHVFAQFSGLKLIQELLDNKTKKEFVTVTNEINREINKRITDSLFFQDFEFVHDKALGEMYSTLERGKTATQEIVKEVVEEFMPVVAGILMSAGFLSTVSPILGGAAFSGLPVMWLIAKKRTAEMGEIYKKEAEKSEGVANRIESIKSGLEVIKTSAEVPDIALHTTEQMNVKDDVSAEAEVKRLDTQLKSSIPIQASTFVAGGVGYALQEFGMATGGDVLASIIYSWRLAYPLQNVVNLYFNKFPRQVHAIKRMEKALGEYETKDLPDGKKENERIPVSKLENFDIFIKDLQYKNILNGVNLEVKQGEFVTIAGESGTGKSTLLRNIVGLYGEDTKQDSGEVRVGGIETKDIKKYGPESIYSAMSYCNQSPQIFDDMTLRENLMLWSKKAVGDPEIIKVLEDLHLDKFLGRLDEKVKHLSGGEKVRIGVARTLIKGAKIMLLDEPTSSLDSQSATEVRNILGEIRQKYKGTTIICVTHDEKLIKSSERVVNMEDINKK